MPERKPIEVAVFDLNKTVYHKSSKEEFFKFVCYRRNYKLLDIFQMGLFSSIRELNLFTKTEFKENFFSYLDHLPPERVDEYAREYWSIEWPKYFHAELLDRIALLRKKGIKIYFITGGLDVYVKPLFENFLIPDAWIATRTQYSSGSYHIMGKACKDEEKIRRLEQVLYPSPFRVVESYSDKKEPVLEIAEQAFLLHNKEIIPF